MTLHQDMIYALGGVPVSTGFGLIGLNGGRAVFLDPANGDDYNDGKTPLTPVKTWANAQSLMTTAKNDNLVLMASATGINVATAVTWDLNYCHVWAATPGLGIGDRCRLVGTTAGAIGTVLTVSGTGNSFHGLQVYNGSNANAATGAVLVSGSRNYFEDCYFVGISGATSGAHAGSYDLSVTGSENKFVNCDIGAETAVRSAGYMLTLSDAANNRFIGCNFRMASDTAGQYGVYYANTTSSYDTIIRNCMFINSSVNSATDITNLFNWSVVSDTYRISIDPLSQIVGFSGWGGDNTKQMYIGSAAPTAATSGIAVKVNS